MRDEFDIEEVKYLARLARMDLKDEELRRFADQLKDILDYVKKLKSVNTDNILPTSHVLPIKNVFRQDIVKKSLPIEEVLENAPSKDREFFKVPAIIEES